MVAMKSASAVVNVARLRERPADHAEALALGLERDDGKSLGIGSGLGIREACPEGRRVSDDGGPAGPRHLGNRRGRVDLDGGW